jgi:ribosome biogenesis protein BRX1
MYKRKLESDQNEEYESIGDTDVKKYKGNKGKSTRGNVSGDSSAATSAPSSSSGVLKAVGGGGGSYTNKQRVLILASRGITARHRHLLEDLKLLLVHHKKDNKLDSKGDVKVVNQIAELKSCNQIIYLEARKHQDLYMYIGQAPDGPSVKFHVVNVHTMDELKLTGNCMQGSRPILNFDAKFNGPPHWQLLKGLLTDAFGTPRNHPKSKPFVDRVMSFFVVKGSIWVRNYQIVDKSDREDGKNTHLVEIGPRMVLIPIRIFSGSLGGPTLYQNPAFVSPNEERSAVKKRKGDRFTERAKHAIKKKELDEELALQPDPLSNKRVFVK